MIQRVFVDANVLYSRTLRDWLFLLRNQTSAMFTVHTTESVLAELIYHLQRDNPMMDGGVITHTRGAILQGLDELVEQYDASIEYNGTDPHDRHVHAAAVSSQADILLTADQGFAKLAAEDTLPYSVYGADAFFQLIDNSSTMDVREVTRQQLQYWHRQKKTKKKNNGRSLTESLVLAGCPEFSETVNEHLRILAGATKKR